MSAHRTLKGAKRRISQLEKQVQQRDALLDKWAKERVLLAKLSAETPQFSNPLIVYEAKQVRDSILKVQPSK